MIVSMLVDILVT